MAEALDCIELVEMVTDYLENSLPRTEVERLEAHLLACSGCLEYIEQMRLTMKALGRLEPERLPDDARAALLSAFRNWKQERDGLG
jgi:hypothetical protein